MQGKDTFTSPYQLFAADIDRNDTINMDDVFCLVIICWQRVKIYRIARLHGGSSQKYDMSAMHMKSIIVDPVPDHISYARLDSMQLHADFLGIKIGDINLSLLDTLKSLSGTNGLETERKRARDHALLKEIWLRYSQTFNESVSLVYNSNSTGPFNVTILDLSGRSVYREKYEAVKGLNKITLNASGCLVLMESIL